MDEAEEAAAFAQVALPHLDAACTLARWLLRDGDAARDVVQDAMLRALTHFGQFRGVNARAWLLQIVRTTAYDHMARARAGRTLEIVGDEVPDPSDGPEVALARVQAGATLADALRALPDELRECVVLRELEELSYRDIARITGVPMGTVMSRLWRARKALLQYGRERLS